MTSVLGAASLIVGGPPAVPGAYPAAHVVCVSLAVGTVQVLAAPPSGYVWVINPWVIFNSSAGVGNVLIFDSDGALGQMQAWAAGFTAFCQILTDKAVSITTDVTIDVGGVAYLMPKPEIYLVLQPTAVYAAVPLVVPAGMIAVPAFARFRNDGFPPLSPVNNYIRGVNADTAGAQGSQIRLTRGATSVVAGNANGKSAGVCNQNNASGFATMGGGVANGDLLEVRLAGAPIVAGSYVIRAVYELIPEI